MKVIVSWSYANARTYWSLRGWVGEPVKLVTQFQELRGLDTGTEVYILGPTRQYTDRARYADMLDYCMYLEDVCRITLTFDDTDSWI